jgi:hypothetical protein
VRVLAGQYQAYNFIAQTLAIEVSDANEESTLFCSNSAAAKLFTMYMRMTSLRYLWQVLVLAVQKMFKLITQSEKILPQELRMLVRRIHDEVHSPTTLPPHHRPTTPPLYTVHLSNTTCL